MHANAQAWTLLALLVLTPGAALAERAWLQEARFGVLAHDVDGLWSGDRAESGVDYNLELILGRPGFTLIGARVSPYAGASVNNRGDTSKLYAGLRWQRSWESGWFLDVGLGLAVHDGERETLDPDEKQLGSDVLFHVPIELGHRIGRSHSLSLYFDHVSNAGLAHENEGLDTLGLRWGYRF